jgi:metal-responsive CopG/Arc/MetJ family transcriptional regulator
MATKRVNLNMDEKLLARIDEYAEYMGVTRTAAISFLCGNQLFQNDTVNAISGAVDVINNQDKESKPNSKS